MLCTPLSLAPEVASQCLACHIVVCSASTNKLHSRQGFAIRPMLSLAMKVYVHRFKFNDEPRGANQGSTSWASLALQPQPLLLGISALLLFQKALDNNGDDGGSTMK